MNYIGGCGDYRSVSRVHGGDGAGVSGEPRSMTDELPAGLYIGYTVTTSHLSTTLVVVYEQRRLQQLIAMSRQCSQKLINCQL